MEIVNAHEVPYIASATIAYPKDLMKKFEKAKNTRGFKLIHLFSPCPPGHKSVESKSVEIAKLAVETGIFPLYEIENGVHKLTRKPKFTDVKEYLYLQGRFKHLDDKEAQIITENIKQRWEKLTKKFEC